MRDIQGACVDLHDALLPVASFYLHWAAAAAAAAAAHGAGAGGAGAASPHLSVVVT